MEKVLKELWDGFQDESNSDKLQEKWKNLQKYFRKLKTLSIECRDTLLSKFLEILICEGDEIGISIARIGSFEGQLFALRFLVKILHYASSGITSSVYALFKSRCSHPSSETIFKLLEQVPMNLVEDEERKVLNEVNRRAIGVSIVVSMPLERVIWKHSIDNEEKSVQQTNIWADFNGSSLTISFLIDKEPILLEIDYQSISNWKFHGERNVKLNLLGAEGKKVIIFLTSDADKLRAIHLLKERAIAAATQNKLSTSQTAITVALSRSKMEEEPRTNPFQCCGSANEDDERVPENNWHWVEGISPSIVNSPLASHWIKGISQSTIDNPLASRPVETEITINLYRLEKKLRKACRKSLGKYLKIRRYTTPSWKSTC